MLQLSRPKALKSCVVGHFLLPCLLFFLQHLAFDQYAVEYPVHDGGSDHPSTHHQEHDLEADLTNQEAGKKRASLQKWSLIVRDPPLTPLPRTQMMVALILMAVAVRCEGARDVV